LLIIKLTKDFLKRINEELKKMSYNRYSIEKLEYKKAKDYVYNQIINKFSKEDPDIEKIFKNRLPMEWGVYTLLYFKDIINGKRIFKKHKLKEKLKLDKEAKEKGYYFIKDNITQKMKVLVPNQYLIIKENGKIKILRYKELKKIIKEENV